MTKRTASELFEAKVRRADGCWAIDTYRRPDGYFRIQVQGKKMLAHRLSWELHNRDVPEGTQIDHTCHNKGCVNPAHLRLVTPKQNNENKPMARADATTGVKGVYWDSTKRRYVAQVKHNGVRVFRQVFNDIGEAERAVTEARRKWFTHNDFEKTE